MTDQAGSQHPTPPHTQADDAGARWMTFNELAEIRGISKLSAVALVRRHRWRRQRNNQKRVIALVPLTWADPETDNQPHSQTDNEADPKVYRAAFETALAAIEAAHAGELATLRDRADAAERRADRAEQAINEERARADQLREKLETAQDVLTTSEKRADRLRDSLDTSETLLAIAERRAREAEDERYRAEDAAEALRQAETERKKARGLLGRLRDAWRGE